MEWKRLQGSFDVCSKEALHLIENTEFALVQFTHDNVGDTKAVFATLSASSEFTNYATLRWYAMTSDDKQPARKYMKFRLVQNDTTVTAKAVYFKWLPSPFIKDKVYRPPMPANLAQLRHRITAAAQEVTPDMLQRVCKKLTFRGMCAVYDQ
ncbi:hypothetical protein C0J52_18608 [Blattella germanica]|nr:hypothetical protein C0J52_18608 [Blattella germanica]